MRRRGIGFAHPGGARHVGRRSLLAWLGSIAVGTALAPPLAAGAEKGMRRIGVLMNLPEGDPEGGRRIEALVKELNVLGWAEGKNLTMTLRWGNAAAAVEKNATELVALAPDLIICNAPPSTIALQHATATVPVVFAAVTDPLALGIVKSLAHPGGNVTGFSPSDLDISSKWLGLLREISPGLKRVAVFQDPGNRGGAEQVKVIAGAAAPAGLELTYLDVLDHAAIDHEVQSFAAAGNGGLIVLRTSEDIAARRPIIAAAARYRLPAVYPLRFCATDGGLVSYGPDIVEEYRQVAGYADRILKGEKPGDLPVQESTKFELVINLRTAKTLGAVIPQTLLATADEVIE